MSRLAAGADVLIANPIVFSDTSNVYDRAPTELGAETDAVLEDELGLRRDEISALRARGIIR